MRLDQKFTVGLISACKPGDIFVQKTRSTAPAFFLIVGPKSATDPYAVLLNPADGKGPIDSDPTTSKLGLNYGSEWDIELIPDDGTYYENHDLIAKCGTIHLDGVNIWLSVRDRTSQFDDTYDLNLADGTWRDRQTYSSVPFSQWRIWMPWQKRSTETAFFQNG